MSSVREFPSITEFFAARAVEIIRATFSGSVVLAMTSNTASGRFGIRNGMERTVYDKRSFRRLPREECVVQNLLGFGDCLGAIHRHHVDPSDPDSRTVPVCNRHHQRLHAALRALEGSESGWKSCPHPPGTHRYPGAREACERRLNNRAA